VRARLPLLAALLLAPGAGRAGAPAAPVEGGPSAPAREAGLFLALRAGLGRPVGDLSRDAYPLADLVRHKVPLGLEAGWRFGRHLGAGLYLEYAPARLDEAAFCGPGIGCAARTIRLGALVRGHLGRRGRVDPWFALGAGFETLSATVYDGFSGGEARWSWSGLDLPVVEVGVDVAVARRLAVGPVLTASFARFTSYSVRGADGSTEAAAMDGAAHHGWIVLGVKAGLRP
jgi:hypothetical protein